MMNCKEFSDLLDAFLDGELTKEQAEQMRRHAAECAECASLLALRRDLRAMEDEVEVPDEFSASWREAVRAEAADSKHSPARAFRQSWIAAAAALVMIFGGALAMSRGRLPTVYRTAGSAKAPAAVAQTAATTDEAPAANEFPAANESLAVNEAPAAQQKAAENDAGTVLALFASGSLSNVLYEDAEESEEIAWEEAPMMDWAAESAEESADMAAEAMEAAPAEARKAEREYAAAPVMSTALPTAEPTPAPAASPAPEETDAPAQAEAPEKEIAEGETLSWLFWLGLAVCAAGAAVLALLLVRHLKKAKHQQPVQKGRN
ncbi:MAG: zf-HC2 domain-containing protein [Clostridiales bacterium]|nr:zf-HC2 domain-containing protein [Clostridiales bacterium]